MSDSVMVPREPTEAMLNAVVAGTDWMPRRHRSDVAKQVWSLMIAASTPAGGWEDIECPACDGSGKIVEAATTTGANQHSACQHDCEDCDGSGRILPQTEKGS
jgi:hypothetical protein